MMPSSKTKPRRTPKKGPDSPPPPPDLPEVLTLAEAAAYLRVSEDDVLRAVGPHGLPGRLIGGEWRFLKPALQDWLRSPPPAPGKQALLRMAGAFKDDPFLEDIVKEAYERRGRPITEEAG